jgi:hypothetical protein
MWVMEVRTATWGKKFRVRGLIMAEVHPTSTQLAGFIS